MRKIVLLVVVVGLVMGATPSAVADAHYMRGTLEGPTVGFNPDPTAVAERCPEGFGWIINSAGGVELPGFGLVPGGGFLESLEYAGPFGFVMEHCSRWVTNPETSERTNGRFVGDIAGGVMTLVTPEGDELYVSYEGSFRFKGDLAVGEWTSVAVLQYRILGGTGVFDGAAGSGHIGVTDSSGYGAGDFEGSLVYR